MDNREHAPSAGDDARGSRLSPAASGDMSQAVGRPPRSRIEAALDLALDTLEACEQFCHEQKAVDYVRKRLDRIRDILTA